MGIRWIAAASAACALAAMRPAGAQSFYGPGGLFLHPTATMQEPGRLTPAFLILPQRSAWTGDDRRTWITGSLAFGFEEDVEIGVAAVGVEGWNRSPSLGGFVKYRFLRESESRPAAAIGFTALDGGELNTRIGFLALRKQFGSHRGAPLVAHLGVQYADEVEGMSHHDWEPYAGVELGLSSRLTFIAEGRPRTPHYFGTPLAVTLAYRVTDYWRLAITWANPGHSDTPHFGFGAGLSLGSRR